jgi:hypothetical protein
MTVLPVGLVADAVPCVVSLVSWLGGLEWWKAKKAPAGSKTLPVLFLEP